MNPFTAWFDVMRFTADSQRVIALRLFKLASNDAKARTEATRMVSEKIAAMMESQAAMAVAAALTQGHRPSRRGGARDEALPAPRARQRRASLARLRHQRWQTGIQKSEAHCF